VFRPRDATCRRCQKARSSFDFPHRLVVNFTNQFLSRNAPGGAGAPAHACRTRDGARVPPELSSDTDRLDALSDRVIEQPVSQDLVEYISVTFWISRLIEDWPNRGRNQRFETARPRLS